MPSIKGVMNFYKKRPIVRIRGSKLGPYCRCLYLKNGAF